jgi:DNA-binding GntR family transcriptional regulator
VPKRHGQPKLVGTGGVAKPPRLNRINHFESAYQRIEDLLINCELKPGRFLAMQELQEITGFGRTPVHNAVNRLAADTLIIVRPRHGLQIAPIDLARERILLQLRKDIERFVVRLATERSTRSNRNQMLHLERALRERRGKITLMEFNNLDRRINKLIMDAANEPFLEHTLRPLHTIFRRIGFIYHTYLPGSPTLNGSVDHHLALLDAVANCHVDLAVAASDALIQFVDGMFDVMEKDIDPVLLDHSIEPLFAS